MRGGIWSRFATWYRQYTGDTQFDDISGPRHLITKEDFAGIAAALNSDLEAMRFNLPMITSETLVTDRVAVQPFSLLPQLTGSVVDIVQPPSYAVSWRHVGPDFAALVRTVQPQIKAWVYSSSETTTRPTIRLWRLHPGRYELHVGPDPDANGQVEISLRTIIFEHRERLSNVSFDLPPRTLCHLQVVELER